MKLSRLEIFGFKSFLNRTVFQFGHGVTSIVGPNGCGKSNIVDAIVWVLGERGTKSLRVKDMGDVIFHGSNGRKPVNIAEVTLDLSDGEKELSVKRRIYRDGVNEYFLNGNPVRLKDVQDAFLGTGIGVNSYAIIEQGRIETFIQMKPLERRTIIEEASGVTRFEEKKRDALTRMDEVVLNLDRVEDVYREITGAFEKARIEWERWKAHKVLADRLHEIDKEILLDGYGKLKKRIGKVGERQAELDLEAARKEEEKAKQKESLETKESEFALTDNIVRQLEVDIKGKEKDMESRLLEIEYVREERQRLEAQCNAHRENEGRIMAQIEANRREMGALEEQAFLGMEELKRTEAAELTLREETEGLKASIEGKEKKLEEERNGLFAAMSKLTEIRNRIGQLERMEKERQAREQKIEAEKKSLRETVTKLEAQQRTLRGDLEAERVARNGLYTRETRCLENRDGARKSLEEGRNELERLRGEKRMKEEFLRRLGGHVGNEDANKTGMQKLINMIRVEENRVKALERFFSNELEYQVLTETAREAISEAVRKKEGSYIFFPRKGLFRLGGAEVEVEVHWVDDLNDALSRIEEGEEGVFLNDGFFVDSRGIILSGKEKKGIDLKQFKEKLKLEKDVKALDGVIREKQAAIEDMQKRFAALDGEYQKARREREEIDRSVARFEKELVFVEAQLKTSTERISSLEGKIDLSEEISPDEMERLVREKEGGEAAKIALEEKMREIKADVDVVKRTHEESRSKWHGVTIDIERKKNRLKSIEEEKQRRTSTIRGLTEELGAGKRKIEEIARETLGCSQKIEGLEKNYEELKKECARDLERYEELKKLLGNLHMEKTAIQETIDNTGREIERTRGKRENADKEMAILTEKVATVVDRLQTTYEIDDPDAVTVHLTGDMEEERQDITREIADMGEINFRAEKEYLELQERIGFLETQREDLRNAMESLKRTITKIEGLTRELFAETFEKVSDAFKRFTETLFRGGKGQLIVNPENGGIEMFVQPPGKKTFRMELLSGGEKALICLALLLALMDTRPSPFALMDEIDAPLDDANLMALLEIMKTMSSKTQILFITHNRITMEGSDAIYGITMEEQGVSKTISVKL